MDYKNISEVYEYIRANRGVGHTTLLKDGALNATYPYLIVGADLKHAQLLAREVGNEFAIPVSITDHHKFRGVNYPLLIDNHTFTTSVDAYVKTVRNQREQILVLDKEKTRLQLTISAIELIPWYKRIFNRSYMKAIRKIKRTWNKQN